MGIRTDGHGHHHTSSHDHFIEIPIEVLLGEIGMHKLLKYAIKDEKSKVEVECAKLEKTHEHHQKRYSFHIIVVGVVDLITCQSCARHFSREDFQYQRSHPGSLV